MITSIVLSTALLQSLAVNAFPNMAKRMADGAEKRQAVPQLVPFPEYPGLPYHALFNQFDAKAQLVSTSGDHAFIAPGPNDIRGPCPGLNAAANHGYLPRNGIADYQSLNTGLWEAFGLDQTATQVLQQTTTFFDGNPLTQKWSIGGADPLRRDSNLGLLNPLTNLLGTPTGICNYGHLKSEGDASITRGDFLAPEDNSNCASYPKFFQELLDLAKERTGGPITAPVLAEHQHNRKLHSIATNPNYFSPAFAGVAFTPAAHLFVFELMANHSAEHPRGLLTPETLMTFFSYERDANGELKYTYGHDRIPDNWYRRSQLDAWTMPDILLAVGQQCAAYPSTCKVGGNTGTVNSFTGVDLGDISGGLMNAQAFTDPNVLGCFLAQNIQAEAPSSLEGLFSGAQLLLAKAKILTDLVPALAPLGNCQNLPPGKSVSQYGSIFPGARTQSSGPRAYDQRK